MQDFLVFAQCTWEVLHHHHQTEEQYFFKELEALTGVPDFCEGDRHQHAAFNAKAGLYKDYIYSVTPADFNAQKFRYLLDAFAGILQEHLVDEIQMLLKLKDYDSKAVRAAFDDSGKKSLGSMNNYR